MTVLGFLHTSPVHVSTFDLLVATHLQGVTAAHVVDEHLLAEARRRGPEAVSARVGERLDDLVAAGADVVCCTCSTIGEVAEAARPEGPPPVFRVDRPMARRAVELGPRVGIVAALPSTVEPTRALVEQEAARAGRGVSLELVVDTNAWAQFETGDHEAYRASVARTAAALSDRVDVVVLAQASMAGAQPLLADLTVPVLSSPRLALEHVARLVGRTP